MEGLKDKTFLVTGIANKRSIAYAIAKKLTDSGARVALTYLPLEKENGEEKIRKVAGDLHPEMVLPLDASKEESITALMAALGDRFGHLDGLVHSIASAKRGELGGRFSDITPDGYQFAHLVSSYSLISLTRHAKPLMQGGGSVITLTYLGAERAVANYNVMGSAKAALEANVRYLAMELGESSIRVNAVSAGPIRTLASAGVKDFIELLREARERAPLRRNVELEEVANVSGFLLSPLSSGMTGQVVYVDCGYNIAG